MAFRKADLAAIDGFAAIREYLADDYQLGVRIAATGKRVVLADTIVLTNLAQPRGNRFGSIRFAGRAPSAFSRPAGYFGYVLTQTDFLERDGASRGVLEAGAGGAADPAGLRRNLLGIVYAIPGVVPRLISGWESGSQAWPVIYVEWRGLRFRLFRDGRIIQKVFVALAVLSAGMGLVGS